MLEWDPGTGVCADGQIIFFIETNSALHWLAESTSSQQSFHSTVSPFTGILPSNSMTRPPSLLASVSGGL